MGQKMTFQQAYDKIKSTFAYLELVRFTSNKGEADFIDNEFGKFTAISFRSVLRGDKNHPKRSKRNKTLKFKKTCLKKYGVDNPQKSKTIRKASEETCLKKYGTRIPSKSQQVKDKIRQTCIERFGTNSPAESKLVQDKIVATNLKLYGVKSTLQVKNVQDKIKATNLEKYGTEHPSQNIDIKEKVKATNLERFGVEFPSQLQSFKDTVKETCLKNFGVEYALQSEEVKSLSKKTCIEKYGVDNPMKDPIIRNKGNETNLKLYGVKNVFQNEQIKEKIKETNLERYGYESASKSDIVKKNTQNSRIKNGTIRLIDGKTVKEFAIDKSYSTTTINKLYRNQGIIFLKQYNKKYSTIEQVIKSILDYHNINYTQQQVIKHNDKNHFPDFVIEDSKLIIECDGLYWHSDAKKDNNNYHKARSDIFKSLGYRSLFFRENEILNKCPIVQSIILAKLGKISKRVFARKCEFTILDTKTSAEFFNDHHLMGKGSGKTYALIYEGEVVSAMRVVNKANHIEVSRFCNRLNTYVLGGFSKLIKQVRFNSNSKNIVSFVDMRYGDGHSLIKLGFKEKTNYTSFQWTNFQETFHRMSFKGNIGYECGMYKIWDCGQKKFELLI